MNKFFSINMFDDKILCYLLGVKLSFKRKRTLRDKISKGFAKKIYKNIKKYKYIHIMKNDKFTKPFVDFLNANFDQNEHMVLCYRDLRYNDIIQKFPIGNNVYEYIDIFDVNLNFSNVDKIIFHSLFYPDTVDYLYKNKELLKKTYWMIWGADLYNAPRDEKNDFVRKNFKGYISDTDGDCNVAMKKYNSNPEIIKAGYTFPIPIKVIDNTKKNKNNFIKIQINNSCDYTTIEMLDILSKFKDENIKITTILSCGKMEFKDEIIKRGKEIFADKFEYLENYMSPQDYAQHLAQNDILILNQNRQQGLGNSFATLALGGKLFIKSEVTTYNHFNSKSIKVFDTNSIKNISFNEFVNYNEEIKISNKEKSRIFFDDRYLKSLWEVVFKG